jgi:tRNA modification GTPase
MKENLFDTVAAVSTPIGEGGISVIRISGSDTYKITENIFFKDKTGRKKFDFSIIPTHTIHFGYIISKGKLIDEALVSVFKSPNSYTGEDVTEISSHGGVFITQSVLNIVLDSGARHAGPGEFTKRAFLNRRIDLSQAEAVADIIKAKTEQSRESSVSQLEGSLSEFVKNVRQELLDITSLVELELDFSEEDVEFTSKDALKEKANNLINNLNEIISSYITGRIIRDGVNVVIAGKPNSGKSSLFNNLLKTERAIVSSTSGTTRDYLEENLIIEGILFNITDTAGLRASGDEIETEGIKRSYGKIKDADLVLYLIDSSDSKERINENAEDYKQNFNSEKTLAVFTKSDISIGGFNINEYGISGSCLVSINKFNSVEELKKAMLSKIRSKEIKRKSGIIVLTNYRHKLCLENVTASLHNVVKSIDDRMSGEFISVDLRNALNFLGEITGEVTNDDILTNIFTRFCIGK